LSGVRKATDDGELTTDIRVMKIDHIGIATGGIDEAVMFWREVLGLEAPETEEVAAQKVRVAMLPIGESRIELLEATSEDSPISKFLQKRGPGIHHIAIRIDDIRTALAQLKAKGARLIDEEPRLGAGGCLVAFVHPSSAGGVLLELVEQPK
jgi:methylmalonyl-CoA/ethylmalonyl-CoA epimerase